MLLLTFNPRQLRESVKVTERELLFYLDRKFLVTDAGIKGYDFTDKTSCDRIKRKRMVSLEWSAQAAVAQASICRFYERNPGPEEILANVIDLRSRIRGLTGNIDKKRIITAAMIYYPYATVDSAQVFPFGGWWKIPRGDPARCGALSATTWRFFMYQGFNPLDISRTGKPTTESAYAKAN
ncbi:MAG: hypothetical protein ABH865_02560 [Candidatus Omnitrophota bacterium]|nr:hypothetical protein [Candidatus Omnitrophota bacterium]